MRKNIISSLLIVIIPFCIAGTSYAEENKKGPLYFGLGFGDATLKFEGGSLSSYIEDSSDGEFQSGEDEDEYSVFHIGIGGVVNQKLHLGVDISSVKQKSTIRYYSLLGNLLSGSAEVQLTNYFAALSYFPFERGLFVKMGGGISKLDQKVSAFFSEDTDSYSGLGYMFGLGYDLRLLGRLHLGLHADYSKQNYQGKDAPEDTDFTNMYISVYIY